MFFKTIVSFLFRFLNSSFPVFKMFSTSVSTIFLCHYTEIYIQVRLLCMCIVNWSLNLGVRLQLQVFLYCWFLYIMRFYWVFIPICERSRKGWKVNKRLITASGANKDLKYIELLNFSKPFHDQIVETSFSIMT